jgi:hypothetical protein
MAQSQFTHKVIQGFNVTWTTFVVDGNGNPVTLSSTYTCEIWPGGGQPQVSGTMPICTLNAIAGVNAIDVAYLAAFTTNLLVGYYDIVVLDSIASIAVAFGYLSVQPAPGTNTTDLITIPFARAALSDYTLTGTQIEFLPNTITAASNAVKRWCGDRDFIQQSYAEQYQVNLDGSIMLNQPPNWITRIQGNPFTVLTITNSSASVQEAYINGTFTGDKETYPGITFTGWTLNSYSNGVFTSSPILLSSVAPPTISGLASAINAVGGGWTAYADTSYGAWPVTELIDKELPRAALNGPGAVYDLYTDDLGNDARIDPLGTGLIWLGRQYPGTGPKWGPDWMEFDAPYLNEGRVQVTYNAGFATVPLLVQKCVANVAKNLLAVLALDPTLASEKAEQYAYVTREQVELLPLQDRQALAFYRLHHA